MIFELSHKDNFTKARAGKLITDHGTVPTPIFMPVGTVGSVKGIHPRELKDDIGAHIILGNTYHLYLRPGTNVLQQAGGLHRFNGWDRPILTDSGGYQIFSLAQMRKLTEEGAWFRSHIDGSKHLFTPENVVDTQRIIGSDIMMALDECTPYPCEKSYARKSLDLTHRWLDRGWKHFCDTQPLYGHSQTFFPIVQGSVFKDLRIESAEKIAAIPCEGNAIGGLAVGEPAEEMYSILETVNNILPENRPRYLMGVGTPENILEAIALGVDMFDCVMPTRNGRNGMLFTRRGIINIRNEKWKTDFTQVDPDSPGYVDQHYTRAYLRHLFVAGEMLGPMIASIHNLSFYLWLVTTAREKIIEGTFGSWKDSIVKQVMTRL
jgi:queuine tRNA-ribosyltransferase